MSKVTEVFLVLEQEFEVLFFNLLIGFQNLKMILGMEFYMKGNVEIKKKEGEIIEKEGIEV